MFPGNAPQFQFQFQFPNKQFTCLRYLCILLILICTLLISWKSDS